MTATRRRLLAALPSVVLAGCTTGSGGKPPDGTTRSTDDGPDGDGDDHGGHHPLDVQAINRDDDAPHEVGATVTSSGETVLDRQFALEAGEWVTVEDAVGPAPDSGTRTVEVSARRIVDTGEGESVSRTFEVGGAHVQHQIWVEVTDGGLSIGGAVH